MDGLRREIGRALEETAYAAVGFAILGVQRAQVARRQIEQCDPAGLASRFLDLMGQFTTKEQSPDGPSRER